MNEHSDVTICRTIRDMYVTSQDVLKVVLAVSGTRIREGFVSVVPKAASATRVTQIMFTAAPQS